MSDGVSQAAWSSWALPFWATAGLLATALLYLRGWREIRRTRPLIFPPWRAWCFLGGLLSMWIAVASPLDTLDGLFLVAHMTQHLILMSVAPPLLLLGAPAVPLLRALPRSVLRDGLGPFFRTPILHRLMRLLTHPVLAWVAMNIAYLGWHVPQAYELALRSPGWHEVEHACFLGTSLLFWFPVIQPWPSPSRASRWALLPYLVGADLVNTALAGFLTFSPRVIYPSYSSLRDQAAAGALMWVVGSIFYLVPVAVIASHLLSPPSRRRSSLANSQPAHIVLPQPKRLDLLQLPLIGYMLRARYGRMALQSIAFVAAVLVIADGFLGRPYERDEPGRRPALDLRAGLRGDRAFSVRKYLLLVVPLHAAAGDRTPLRPGPFQMAALAAQQVDRDCVDDPVLLVLRSLCYLGPSPAHSVAPGRVFRSGLPGGHLLPRGQLL